MNDILQPLGWEVSLSDKGAYESEQREGAPCRHRQLADDGHLTSPTVSGAPQGAFPRVESGTRFGTQFERSRSSPS
jgi:hypothetical protein